MDPTFMNSLNFVHDQIDRMENSLNIFRTYIPLDHIYIHQADGSRKKIPIIHPDEINSHRIEPLPAYTDILKNIAYYFEIISSISGRPLCLDSCKEAIIIRSPNRVFLSYR